MRTRPLVACVFVLLGAGCAVDQKKEVAQYEAVLRANLLWNEPPYSTSAPLTLRQALDLTNRQNERLAIEGETYLQSLIDRQRAAANFLPTITLVPAYQFRQEVATGTGNSSSAQTNVLDVPLNGQINLFNGMSDVARARRDDQTIQQRRDLLLDLQERILLETARVYYDILRAERTADVLQGSLSVQDARVRDIRGRQQAGLARPLDVAQTEAQASATRVAMINALSDARSGRTVLAYLTAAPVQASVLVDRFDAPATLPTLEAMQKAATESRRDLRASEAGVRAARHEVDVAFGQYYPSVRLNADYFVYRESFPDDRQWQGILEAQIPLFSAGLIRADVRQAWSAYRQAALDESLTRRRVVQEVELAAQDLDSIGKRLSELQVQLGAAEQAFNQADQSYNVGLATNLERIAAQDQLLNAQLQITSARFDRTLAYLALARSTGQLSYRLEHTTTNTTTSPTTAP